MGEKTTLAEIIDSLSDAELLDYAKYTTGETSLEAPTLTLHRKYLRIEYYVLSGYHRHHYDRMLDFSTVIVWLRLRGLQ